MASTTFESIDHSILDRYSRRTVRNHVMKGRNIGKGRPSHRRQSFRSQRQQQSPYYNGENPKPTWQLGNELSGLAAPCEMTHHSRHFINDFLHHISESMYPRDMCTKVDMTKTIWFQYLLVDEAYFHCFVAMSQACVDFAQGKGEDSSPEHRHHMSMALRLINQKLSSNDATRDTTIAGVTSLCILSSVREQPTQTKAHFDGLCRMIEVRGGVDELRTNPALVEKAHSIDIDLAFQLGCAPRLADAAKPLDAIVPIFSNKAFEVPSPLINAVRHAAETDVFLVAQDVMKAARLFNSNVAAAKIAPHQFKDMLLTLSYRLLTIDTVSGTGSVRSPVAHAIHLGLCAFMTTFMTQYGRQRGQRFGLLGAQLKAALDNETFREAIDPGTHLWLLIVGSVSVFGGNDLPWLASRLGEVADAFGTTDWKFAKRLLSKFPWVSALHDKHASQIWEACFMTLDD